MYLHFEVYPIKLFLSWATAKTALHSRITHRTTSIYASLFYSHTKGIFNIAWA